MINNALLDNNFINELLCQTEREIFARITVLTQDEKPIEFIEGKATGGSINVDGKSAIRRSCSLNMVAEDVFINEFYWGLRNKFKLEIGLKNNVADKYDDIIWFPQGIFVITNFDTNLTAKKWTITIKGKDKMCLLNGELGGHLPHNTEFGRELYHDLKTDTVTETLIPIKTIIREAVRNFGNELPQNIIINNIEEEGFDLLEYRGNTPMYMFRKVEDDTFTNVSFNINQPCYYFSSTGWTQTVISDDEHIIYDNLVDLEGEIEPTKVKFHNSEAFEQLFYISKFDYGSTPGYRLTDLVYNDPKNLISKAGDTVVSLLDKLKKMLVDYEYFYNLEGKFVFQKQQKYNTFNWQNSEMDEVLYADATLNMEKPVFSFLDDKQVISFKNTPKLQDLKNDFSIWGTKRSPSGAENPIHARYAVDEKPKFYQSYDGTIYISDRSVLESDGMKEILKQTAINKIYKEIDAYVPSYKIPENLDKPTKLPDGSWSPGWWDIRDWANFYKLLTGSDKDPPYSMKWYSKGDHTGYQAVTTKWNGSSSRESTLYVWLIIISPPDKNGKEYWNSQHGGTSSLPNMQNQRACTKYESYIEGNTLYTKKVQPTEIKYFPAPYSGCNDSHTYLEFLVRDVLEEGNQVVFYNPDFPSANYDDLVIDRIEQEQEEMFYNGTIKFVDWREIIYQMSLDYNKHYHDDDFLYQVAQKNIGFYPSGQTGYERYYTDLNGFWRTLYDPNPIPTFEAISYLEAPEHYRDENLYIQHSYRKLEMDEKDELIVDITKLYVLDYNRDPQHPDIIPFLGSEYCKLEDDYDLYFYVDPETNTMNSGETNPYKLNQVHLADIYLKNRGPFITNEIAFEKNTEVNANNYVPNRYYLKTFKEGYYLYNDIYNINLQYYIQDKNGAYKKVSVGRDVYEPGKYFEKLTVYDPDANYVPYEQYYVVEDEHYYDDIEYYKLHSATFTPVTITRQQFNRKTYFVYDKTLPPDADGYVEIVYKPATGLFDENIQYYEAIDAKYIQVSFSDYLFEPNKFYVWKEAGYTICEDDYSAKQTYYSPIQARKHFYVKEKDDGVNAGLGGESKYQYWVFKYPFGTAVGEYYDDYTNYASLQLEKYLEAHGWDNLYIQTEGHIKFQDLDLNIQRLYYKQAGILTEYLTNPQYDNYNNMKTTNMELTYDIYGILPKAYDKIDDYKKAIQKVQEKYVKSNKIYNEDLINQLWLLKEDDYDSKDEFLEALHRGYEEYLRPLRIEYREIVNEKILTYQQVHYKKAIYNYKRDSEHGDYWTLTINNNPEDLIFWFDFINGESSNLGKYSVRAIGPRTKVVNDKNIKSIYYKEVPHSIFIESLQDKEKYEYQTGYTYIQLNKGMTDSLFTMSSKGKSVKEALDNLLYTNSYATENTTIQTTPVYHLQPNTRIYIRNDDTKVDGEYLISKLTIPLDHKKMMSITAVKVVPSIT